MPDITVDASFRRMAKIELNAKLLMVLFDRSKDDDWLVPKENTD